MVLSGGTFKMGGDLTINRVGYGAMQLTGPGIYGPPEDEHNARTLLRRAVDLGVNFIDTADVYGPHYNEQIIRDALSPYPDDLVIATKAGLIHGGPESTSRNLVMDGTAVHIRNAVEGSLRRLGVERIDLYQLHRIDPAVPIEDTMDTFRQLRDEGKIRYIGLSEVTIEEIERARKVVEIATVQNLYNLIHRKHDDVLAYCNQQKIGFMPWYPLKAGKLATSHNAMAAIIERTGANPAQIALSWLLRKSPVMLLIPGTSSIKHLEENIAACEIELFDEEINMLDAMGKLPQPGT